MAFVLLIAAPARAGGYVAGAPNKFTGWWELGGYYGTDDASRGEVALFVPIGQTASTILFMDVRGKMFEDDVQEGNLAFGHRRMLNSGWNFGFWGGLDVRSTDNDNAFWQASGGLEMLSERWDMRVNGYAPISDPESSPSTARVFLSGNSILMAGGAEVPLYGVDGEIGFKLFGGHSGGGGGKDDLSHGRRTELRVYGGGFWFDDEDAVQEVVGPKARIEFRIEDIIPTLPGSRLTLESEYSHDDVRDDKWEVGARLRIPFGTRGSGASTRYAALSAQEIRMTESLERDTDIVTTESKEETVLDNVTNVALNRVATVTGGGDLQGTIDANGANTLIIARDGAIQGNVTLQAKQTLQGGGSTIQLRGASSGTIVSFTAPGAEPRIVHALDNPVLTIASSTHIHGVGISGAGQLSGLFANDGIFAPSGTRNIEIGQTTIMDVGGEGIGFRNNTVNVRVLDNTISNTGADGVEFGSNNTNVLVSGNTISNATADGVEFNSNNTQVHILDNTISNAAADGIIFEEGNSTTIAGNTLIDIGSQAIDVGEGAAANTLTITDNVFAGTIGADAVEFDGTIHTLIDGSGNQIAPGATIVDSVCELNGGSFTGTLQIGGFTFVDGVPCT